MDGSRSESLALSSWNGAQHGCCSDLIGCVTFGVKHLLGRQKPVLDDTSYKPRVERGPRRTVEGGDAGKGDQARKTARARRISGLQSHKIVVECLNKGYGFTVRGRCPTRVGHVKQGCSAQLAGLREGDYITHINSCDVTYMGKQDVAKVVRQAHADITLDIRRHAVQSPWQQEVVDSLDNLQLDLGMSAAERASSQSRSSPRQQRDEGRVEEDGHSRLSSEVTFDLLSVPVEEQERLSAVENMRVLEEEFISQMQSGIQRFSRPLRHCLVSSNQHAALFQNVEKLVTISEYYLSELTQTNVESDSSGIGSGDDDVISNEIGAIYRAKVKMCSEAYHVYSDGLPAAIQLLGSLMVQPSVISFLEDADKVDASELSIEDFLCKPVQHLEQVYRGFERILLYTSPDNADYDNLQYVARALGSVCTLDSTIYEKSSDRLTSTPGSRSHKSSRRQHRQRPNTSCTSRNMSKTAAKILSDRPVLFSGELTSVCAATCRPLLVLLLNDSLVMMSVDSEGHMTLAGEPLVLKDIVRMQFDCDHPTDFILSTRLAQNDGVIATRNYRLRAGCYDDKVAWRNLLEYQVNACVSPRKIWSVSV